MINKKLFNIKEHIYIEVSTLVDKASLLTKPTQLYGKTIIIIIIMIG